MAYRCVHCSRTYKDGSNEVLSGCSNCGSKFFFYIKNEKLKEISEKTSVDLNETEMKQIEQDVREIAGLEDEEKPVFLDFESVKVIKPGKYLLDLAKLFASNKPKVYQIEDGKYVVDLSGISREIEFKEGE
jgi:predicted  nucleic acid-binding Zn-ribbon protein